MDVLVEADGIDTAVPDVISSDTAGTYVRDPFVEEIVVSSEVNEPGPLLLLGAAALALIAAFGGAAAACKYMCSPKTVKSCSMKYFPLPELNATCR